MRRLSGILLFVLFSVCCFAQGDNIYYIDSRSGSDSHDGLSPDRAWKTFSIANNKEFKPGDRILLKCGSKWSGSLAPKGSGSDEAPITIASYGEGERPVIDGGGIVKAPVYLRNQSNWTIQGLEVTNPAPERGFVYRGGILVENDNGGVLRNINILDNYVHHVTSSFRYAYDFHPHQFGGIAVNVTGSKGTDKFRNVLIEGNKVENTGRTGIVVWDHIFAKYDEASTGVRIKNNSVKDIDSDGILTYGCDGAIIEYNVADGCGSFREDGGFNGSAAIWCTRGSNCIIQYNEAFNTHMLEGNADGTAFDIDIDAIDCIVQYNYSHDNEGGFMLFIDASNSSGSIVRYNISQNDKTRIFMVAGGVPPNMQIYNNTIYISEGLDTKIIEHTWDEAGNINAPWIFKNNIIYNYGSGEYMVPGTGGIFSNNIYWGNHPASEPKELNKITKDPMLESPGSGKRGLDSLSGYKPKKKSPAINAGAVIDHNGGLDFFGNKISVHDRPNIGAN
ncbi:MULTISPECIES: right-handed parallel beta-helix repeat-containing protein [unclassified Dysgonomonas]|jgi:hypothetical protein|uniref:right-handed parallel beta-helix repeat-containing protein n=1 Tax=unclassified Dysgonomonas TaxID=2630389 RepID=UPI0025BBD0FC|nr:MULTISPECIES: right-handed parallel beta-helix repeat-containing protein [unclassified Dysgonomonas]MDR2003147.1 right-handed parallel beta-helix repeat-containing protein [Prevotella sp.]HMM04098.1 right-handed parallel beta-helix repeat-containing protein [Dysgonomonas sp.]